MRERGSTREKQYRSVDGGKGKKARRGGNARQINRSSLSRPYPPNTVHIYVAALFIHSPFQLYVLRGMCAALRRGRCDGKGGDGEKVRSNETLDGSRAALKPPSMNPVGVTNRLHDTRTHNMGQRMQS